MAQSFQIYLVAQSFQNYSSTAEVNPYSEKTLPKNLDEIIQLLLIQGILGDV